MGLIISKKSSYLVLILGSFLTLTASNDASAISLHQIQYIIPNHSPLLNSVSATRVQEEKAEKFIATMGDKAIGFLSNKSLSQASKEQQFKGLLEDHFDMATIGRFALGKNWKIATPAQQNEYQSLFEKLVVSVYSQRFEDYKGEGFDVISSRASGKKDVLVTSYIIPENGSKVQIDWRLRDNNGQYKIIDVIIEGVSMSLTQRSDFSSVIQRGGGNIEVLLNHLRR